MTNIQFTGVFDRYKPIDGEPHYIFTTSSDTYLISCKDYPALISELSPGDLVEVSGDVDSRGVGGIKLVNVEFGEIYDAGDEDE